MTTQQRARAATSAAFAAQGLAFSVLLTHLPEFTAAYGLTQGAVTLVVLGVVVLAGVGSVVSERVALTSSSRRTLQAGLVGVAATTALVALAPGGLVGFLAGFALYGLALGTVDAAGNMQAVAVQHAYGRSIITSFHAVWSAAAIVGALFVAGGEHVGLPLAPSVLAAAAVVAVLAGVAGPRLLVDDPAPTTAPAPDPAPPRGRRRGPSTALVLLGAAMACFWAVDSSVSDWSALYLDDLGAGPTAALGYALYQATGLVSRLLGDPAVRRFGATRTVRAGAVLGTAGGLVVVLAPGPVPAVVGFGLVGLGLPVLAPLCFAAAADVARRGAALRGGVVPLDAVNRVVARLNVVNYVGALLGAVLVGVVGTVADLRAGFVLPVLLAGALVLLAPAFEPRTTRADAPVRRAAGR